MFMADPRPARLRARRRAAHRSAVTQPPPVGPEIAAADGASQEPSITAVIPGAPSAMEKVLSQGRPRAVASMLGPAFVAAIAYVDPGNFAADLQGGAAYGYLLMWVVLIANLAAILIQYLSAKLGIVTDRNLPELAGACLPRPAAWGMWLQAEVMAMSTDVAEFLGAALGLNLLFGVPMLPAGLITGLIAFAILGLQTRGHRRFELAITALLGVVVCGFLYETLCITPSVHASMLGLVPGLKGAGSLYLAVSIIGATVMPHAIYLHSALTSGRVPCNDDAERQRVLRFERLDVAIALGLAGLVNMAMLAVAAKVFHTPALSGLTSVVQAHLEFGRLVGGTAALAFAAALLASGVSSSSVGTYAGQIVMAGFINIRIPMVLRRALTMIPALIVLAVGVNLTAALVLSQVVLCFGVPLAVVPLAMLTARPDVMGVHVNHRLTSALAWTCVVVISALDLLLIAQQVVIG